MNSIDASIQLPSRARGHFTPYHRWDRNFFLLWVLLIALCIAIGFGREILQQIRTHQSAPPLVVRLHAVVYVGWLVLLMAQVLLIRTRKVHIHRRLGIAGMVLAGVMVVVGTVVALSMARVQFRANGHLTPLLSTQLADMLAFAGLAGAAFLLVKQPAAHKRLILLATVAVSDAGFARLLGWQGVPLPWLFELFRVGGGGELGNFWPDLGAICLGPDILILILGVYDWITRRRLHAAYVAGVAYVGVLELLKIGLMVNPFWQLWKPVAIGLIGH